MTLESVKGGGSSIKVGTIGRVGSLMTRVMDNTSPKSPTASESHGFCTSKSRTSPDQALASSSVKHRSTDSLRRRRVQNCRIPIIGVTATKRQKQKTLPESSTSRDRNKNFICRSPDYPRKSRTRNRTHWIPILGAENMVLERTPSREDAMKKITNIVGILEENCGSHRMLRNRLKKLGFSKLSQSIT